MKTRRRRKWTRREGGLLDDDDTHLIEKHLAEMDGPSRNARTAGLMFIHHVNHKSEIMTRLILDTVELVLKRKEGNLRENGNIIIRGYDSREDGDLWMNIREEMEAKELEFLSPYAACSVNSRGRDKEETVK